MSDGLWGMALGAVLLLAGMYGLRRQAGRRSRRRTKLCLLCGGCLFVLGVTFVCCPQGWGGNLLWLWGGGTALLLGGHEWLSTD